jgi:hypothetical protein
MHRKIEYLVFLIAPRMEMGFYDKLNTSRTPPHVSGALL